MTKEQAETKDPLKPSPNVLIALGSALVHFEEFTSPNGHAVDLTAAQSIMAQPDVKEWMEGMRRLAFLPVKR